MTKVGTSRCDVRGTPQRGIPTTSASRELDAASKRRYVIA